MGMNFISAEYNSEEKKMTAWTKNQVVEFWAYSQQEHDNYVTIENLKNYLVGASELPEEYQSYEQWAEAIFDLDEQDQIMLDDSYCCEWSHICKLAGVNEEDLPYSSCCTIAPYQAEEYSMDSNLFPVVCVSTYESILSPLAYEDYLKSLDDCDKEYEYNYYIVDFSDWKKELTTVATNYIKSNFLPILRKYGVMDINGTGVWSPKYYNYVGDALDMEITMKQDWKSTMEHYLQIFDEISDCQKYIKENWYSCDGFCSFMPKSVAEVLTETDQERQLAAYLTLALVYEDCLEPAGDSMEKIYEAGMYEFSDYTTVNVLEEYYSDSDELNKLLKLYDDDTDWNELYWSLANKIGFCWLHDNSTKSLEGIKDCDYSFHADSDGKRLLFWAVINNYTVVDLRELAA